jgi:transposase-like protein
LPSALTHFGFARIVASARKVTVWHEKPRDRDELKQMAQAIYLAADRKQVHAAFRCFKPRWQTEYPTMVKQLGKDLPNCWRFSVSQNISGSSCAPPIFIERCFVEVRRRTRPTVCFVNVKSVDRNYYSIFYRFNLEWKKFSGLNCGSLKFKKCKNQN